MAKNQPNKGNKRPAQAQNTAAAPTASLELPEFFTNSRLHLLVVAAIAFMAYIGTLGHQFVQDDAIVITDNMFTQKGAEGIGGILSKDTFFGFFKVEGKDGLVAGGRYRPFTLVLFALLYQMVGANPFVFHLFTVLLYAAVCVVMYQTIRLLLAHRFGENYATLTALVASVLFAVHPIHTEVVANVKGCDEIVTLLGSLGALWFTLRAHDTGEAKWGWLGALVFFLACMSKENAVTFLAVVPLALWVFRGADSGTMIARTAPLFLGFLLFFVIRGSILHWKFGGAPLELMNNPYIKWTGNGWTHFSFAEKYSTIVYTLGQYIKLLLFPATLTHDYYPNHIKVSGFGDPMVLLTIALYAGLIYYALRDLKQRGIIGFGIMFYLLTLSIVSNVVFPIGTNMGERFAFMPSVGFCLIVAVLLINLLKNAQGWNPSNLNLALGIAGVLALGYGFKTISRVPAWETNEKLFFTDVTTSVNSAKIRNACGGVLFDKARVETDPEKRKQYSLEAIPHLDKALDIYKDYADAYVSRGGAHLLSGNYEKSIADYRTAIQLQNDKPAYKSSLATALREAGKYYGEKKGDLAAAVKSLNESWQISPTDAETARLLGVASGIGKNHEEAIKWFSKAIELSPKEASYYVNLGTAYMMAGNQAKAQEAFAQAQLIDPQAMQKMQR
jgi:protein O-mannosyl-transferase